MKCKKCQDRAVFSNPALCKKHFIPYFEAKVKNTIKNYNLIKRDDKVICACSGGKDSITVLYLVNKFFKNVDAIAIDEGIEGYRKKTLKTLKLFCEQNNIQLKIYSFKKELGYGLDGAVKKTKLIPCTICGIYRRYFLNKKTKGYTKIVTGHNMDDEIQSIVMNLLRNNMEVSARLGPKTGIIENKMFVQRVKPLYFCTEKEVMVYSLLMKFPVNFSECPYAKFSYRLAVRDMLNDYEAKHSGTKQKIIDSFMKMLPRLKKRYKTEKAPNACSICGEPSYNKICKACTLSSQLQHKNLNKLRPSINV